MQVIRLEKIDKECLDDEIAIKQGTYTMTKKYKVEYEGESEGEGYLKIFTIENLHYDGKGLASNMQAMEFVPMIDCVVLGNGEVDGETINGVGMEREHVFKQP